MKTERLLVIVIVLQLVMLAGQWLGNGPKMLPAAQAEPFNAGADRQAMIDILKSIDSKLESMNSILNSGNLQVKVQQPDEHKK